MIFKGIRGGRQSKPLNQGNPPQTAAAQSAAGIEARVKKLSKLTAAMVAVAIVAAGYGLVTGVSTATTVSQLKEDTVPSLCAAVDIPAGTQISEDMLVLKQVPRGYAVSTPLDDSSLALGQRTLTDIAAGAQLTTALLAGAENTSTLANNLGTGMVAVTIATDVESGLSGLLRQGDQVRIVYSEQRIDGSFGTSNVVEKARVSALDSLITGQSNAYSSITVEVTPGQADAIKAAEAKAKTGGKVDVVLLAKADEKQEG